MKNRPKIVVVGVGGCKWGVRQATLRDMVCEAAKACFDDAKGLLPKDIDSFVFSSVYPERSAFQSNISAMVSEMVGISPSRLSVRVEHMCQSGNVGIRHAYQAVASGYSDIVMVLGAEKMYTPTHWEQFHNMMCGTDREWEGISGITAPPYFALAAQAHMRKFGTKEEQLAMISVKNHRFSSKNPNAQFQNIVTVEDVMKSRVITSPLKLFDCSSMTDGASACIITTEERAKEITNNPLVYILGFGQAIQGFNYANVYDDFSHWPPLKRAAESAFAMAGITPKDIDVAEVHDCFTIAELIAYEEIGFCPKGEGGNFAEKGESDIGGKTPVNTDGGLVGKGHPLGATGVSQCQEIVKQLRGKATFQVKDAKFGLAHNNSGVGAHIVTIYGRDI